MYVHTAFLLNLFPLNYTTGSTPKTNRLPGCPCKRNETKDDGDSHRRNHTATVKAVSDFILSFSVLILETPPDDW